MADISDEELAERVAILRRFRSLLEQQRKKFKDYLTVLEKQETSIEEEDTVALAAHTELEQQVAMGIESLQKVIVPMSEMYKESVGNIAQNEQGAVSSIQEELNALQQKVLEQNKKNKELLQVHLVKIKTQLEQFRNPYKNRSSVYAMSASSGSLVTVEA
ncbi:MAG: flagellar biosynthesis protein FlgN [Treponema sp.]|nr:flagellar biosynthesis protein FlgN [Treponema sp.]